MKETEILIIGAGIAGLVIAKRLFEADSLKEITLIEQKSFDNLLQQSHPSVVLEPAFVVGGEEQKKFNLEAYYASLDFYSQLDAEVWHSKGLIKIANATHLEKKQIKLIELICSEGSINSEFHYLSKKELSQLASAPINHSGIYYPNAGLLNPRKISERIISQTKAQIEYLFAQPITKIEKKEQHWIVFNHEQNPLIKAKKIVYAAGFSGLNLIHSINGELNANFSYTRGQISIMRAKDANFKPRVTISGDGFISSVLSEQLSDEGLIAFGSSWDRNFNQPFEVKITDHQENLAKANRLSQDQFAKPSREILARLKASVSVRLNTKERKPLLKEMDKNFWLFTALGSRGYQYAPYLSEKLLQLLKK